MLIKFIVFTIGLDIIVININYIILYLIIGIFIIIISFKLPKGEYNDIWYCIEF